MRRRGPRPGVGALAGLVVAEGTSLLGSRITFVALPWLVLETTGSSARTGVVAFAEMLPYVAACALGGPFIDRRGSRPTSIGCDLGSAVAVGSIPLLHAADLLPFGALVGVTAVAGALRGIGDTAKRALFPPVVAAADVDLTRATGIRDGASRLADMLGAPLAGVLVATVGAAEVVLLDAASFALTATIVAAVVRLPGSGAAVPASGPASGPDPAPADEGHDRYGAALRTGLDHLLHDRLVLGFALLLLAANLFDSAYLAVYAPVWAHDVVGSPRALGLVLGAFGLGAVAGNVAFNVLAPRLPRYATFTTSFVLGSAAPMLVMAAAPSPVAVAAAALASGVICAPINPILAAVAYERVPADRHARVIGLIRATAWAGIPLGGLLGGLLVAGLGLTTALVVTGAGYFAVTLVPLAGPTWRQLDARPARPASSAVAAGRRSP